jgi:hypothetical protein
VSVATLCDALRERWLALAGLALALLALALSLAPGAEPAVTRVLAVRHALPAGGVVRTGDVVAVSIRAADRTPSMLAELGPLAVHRTAVALAAGDYVSRGALRAAAPASLLARGERAVSLEVPPSGAPDVRLLGAGRRVDVVTADAGKLRVAARGLELLAPAAERAGALVVTLRAPAAVALALATQARGRELRLLLRGDGP